jgi:RimJ/RimL family protein N-acetyltransferase
MSVYLYDKQQRLDVLYNLLEEREPEQNISHKKMPTRKEHEAFVERHPYTWYFICADENYDIIYGSVYVTNKREVGIQIFNEYKNTGVATLALKQLMEIHEGTLYANINPDNAPSIKFFEKHGFKHIQNTYALSR